MNRVVRYLVIVSLCLIELIVSTAIAETDYAIVVGIDGYQAADLIELRNAENDARGVGAYFRSQGYNVTEILGSSGNARKSRLESVVNDIGSRLRAEDSVVLFFAGHGATEIRNDIKLGYFVMLPDGRDKKSGYISSGDMLRYSDKLDLSRHQLFIFDFCYSGLLGRLPTRGATPVDYTAQGGSLRDALYSRKARQFLSAGGDDQQVLDSGPSGLSWFTYFLLKGLEPGIVNDRESGLIIFTELAAYVKVNSANRYHTPADGSMLGHQGGDYLFYNTLHSRPQPDQLPVIDRETLAALGFITRGEQETIRASLADMQRPIDELNDAWSTLNVDQYLDQLHPDIVQTVLLKNGTRISRGYDEIARKRREQFPRLDRVNVLNYEVMYQGGTETEATFGVRYSMDFEFNSPRKTVREHNKKECYKVAYNHRLERWQIIRNDDYLQRICSYD